MVAIRRREVAGEEIPYGIYAGQEDLETM